MVFHHTYGQGRVSTSHSDTIWQGLKTKFSDSYSPGRVVGREATLALFELVAQKFLFFP